MADKLLKTNLKLIKKHKLMKK